MPRMANGKPDFSGYWNNHTLTPLERPDSFKGREFLTDAEFKQMEEQAARPPAANPNNPFPNLFNGDTRWVMTNKRTSMITDPKDGKLPPLTPEAKQQLEAAKSSRGEFFAGPEELSTFVRCLPVSTSGPPMLPSAYNNNYQIVQTSDYVVIATEMMHDVRIIAMDGRPHAGIPQWTGDSVGHWEGDTLVVETTNFNGKRGYFGVVARDGDRDIARPDAKMTVTERFTRTDKDTLLYQFTVNDPGVYTRPWSGEITMKPFAGTILEYACTEANQALYDIMSGARVQEREAAAKGRK